MNIEERLASLEARVARLEGAPKAQMPNTGKPQSLREFINSLKPKSANDTALAIGYYAEIIEASGFFTNDTLRDGFAQAKLVPPKNLSDVVGKNAKKGFIMPARDVESKLPAWVLTNTGEAYIEQMKADD